MDRAQRAKAMIVQLETLRGSERLNPALRILTHADCVAAQKALDAATTLLPPPVWLELEARLEAILRWLTERTRSNDMDPE